MPASLRGASSGRGSSVARRERTHHLDEQHGRAGRRDHLVEERGAKGASPRASGRARPRPAGEYAARVGSEQRRYPVAQAVQRLGAERGDHEHARVFRRTSRCSPSSACRGDHARGRRRTPSFLLAHLFIFSSTTRVVARRGVGLRGSARLVRRRTRACSWSPRFRAIARHDLARPDGAAACFDAASARSSPCWNRQRTHLLAPVLFAPSLPDEMVARLGFACPCCSSMRRALAAGDLLEPRPRLAPRGDGALARPRDDRLKATFVGAMRRGPPHRARGRRGNRRGILVRAAPS